MDLWILRPHNSWVENDEAGPWGPWYDKAFGFIVCAHDEKQARKLAQEAGGDETDSWAAGYSKRTSVPAWADPKYSSCVKLRAGMKPEVIMKDFAAA